MSLVQSPRTFLSSLYEMQTRNPFTSSILASTSPSIADVGLKELKDLKNLKYLLHFVTKVTDAGVKELKEALPKCEINH
jgi:hypothetical protein